jgi:hypothetical protein
LGLILFDVLHPAGLNDLYMFDPVLMEWSRIDGNILGTAPVGRYNAGFSAVGDSLCLFGGNSKSDQGMMSRMRMHFFDFLKGDRDFEIITAEREC